MAGRRLTISALLCDDEQPLDSPQPPPADTRSTSSTSSISASAGSFAVSDDLRDGQGRRSSPVESRDNAFRTSIPSPHISRDSHNPVPLSLQPVHHRTQTASLLPEDNPIPHHSLRRGYGGNVPDHLETPASASRSPLVLTVSRDSVFASYHDPHPLPQATPRRVPTSRRSSDPRRSTFNSVEGSSYFAPTSSGKSAHSDPLVAAYTYPPPLPPQSSPKSSHHTPAAFSLSQPVLSPVRSTIFARPRGRSPPQFYNPMAGTSPPGDPQPSSQSPGPSRSPASACTIGPPLLSREEANIVRPTRMRSASHNQSGSPPSVVSHTTSATALPNLLNSGSPRSPAIAFNPHGSSGGLGALEALVQVATEERRRLSGELPTPLERHESARRASLSPVQNRHPPPLPLPSQSPAAQRSPPLPSPRHEARVSSLGFISLGQSHPHDGEPPSKKRRRTSSVLSGPVAVPPPPAPSLHAPPSPATSASPRPRSISQLFANNAVSPGTLIADPISDLKPPPPLSDPPIAPSPSSDPSITPAAARETEETPQPVEELLAQAAEAEIKPLKDESNAVSATAPTNVPLDVHEEIVKTEESNVSLPALTVHAPDAVPNTVADGVADTTTDAPPVPNTQQPRKRSKEDAHEWLLEHYATDSPAAVPNQHSPPPEGPPDTPEPPAASPLPSAKEEEGLETADSSPAEIHAVKEDASKHEAPSRTHTPLALLEAELNRATSDERIVPSIAISPTSDADLAMELALAADASEQSTSVGRGPSTSNDLDDELLSLVDDKPRQSHLHLHSSAKIAHSPSSSSHVEKPPEAKEGSLKKLFTTPAPRPLSATPAPSESVVMPPPIAPPSLASKSAPNDQQSATKSEKAEPSSASSSMKKKEPSAKPAQKAKAPAKPKAKAPTAAKPSKAKVAKDGTAASSGRATPSGGGSTVKGKKTTVSTSAAAAAAKRSVSAAVGQSRSRSSSVMPAPPEPASKPQREEEEESEEEVDDKLYCICKTHYDEDKVMIACDRCDEWYHTQCLNMNDLEVDLIDQFVCPPCIEANPHLPLKTTYKQRCFAGLKHPRPSSAAACHKPARGAFSKYCSDECGIAYMQRRIDGWGGDQEVLWASVREVKPREGVVVKISAIKEEPNGTTNSEPKTSVAGGFGQLVMETHQVQKPIMTQYERAITRLHGELYKIAPKREALKKDLEIIMWRQKLLELAAARAERVEECGWDHRLCLDDDEFAEFAAGILESYEESRVQVDGDPEAMQVDGTSIEDGAWWCRGKRKCQRHAGWQKLRALEYEFDQELKEKAMSVLTTQEREIRKQLEDVVSLQARKANMFSIGAPLQPLNGRAPINGTVKAKTNGTGKKGKQRK